MSAIWLPDILSDAFRGIPGYQVDVVSGWRTRSAKSTLFEPRGVMNHHTGWGSYEALLNFMALSASTAPLSQVASSRPYFIKGLRTVRFTIMAAGRCNHAGAGYESWTGVDGGNRYSVAFENQNDGQQSWPSQQLEGIWIANAAVLDYLNRGVDRLTDHKTYARPPGRKPDPHSLSLAYQRAQVRPLLGGADMPLNDTDLAKIREQLISVLGGDRITWTPRGETEPRSGNQGILNSIWWANSGDQTLLDYFLNLPQSVANSPILLKNSKGEEWTIRSSLKNTHVVSAATYTSLVQNPSEFIQRLIQELKSGGGSGSISDEQLERVLRKVFGSLGEQAIDQ